MFARLFTVYRHFSAPVDCFMRRQFHSRKYARKVVQHTRNLRARTLSRLAFRQNRAHAQCIRARIHTYTPRCTSHVHDAEMRGKDAREDPCHSVIGERTVPYRMAASRFVRRPKPRCIFLIQARASARRWSGEISRVSPIN